MRACWLSMDSPSVPLTSPSLNLSQFPISYTPSLSYSSYLPMSAFCVFFSRTLAVPPILRFSSLSFDSSSFSSLAHFGSPLSNSSPQLPLLSALDVCSLSPFGRLSVCPPSLYPPPPSLPLPRRQIYSEASRHMQSVWLEQLTVTGTPRSSEPKPPCWLPPPAVHC